MMKRKILVAILALVMLLSILPVGAMAEEAEVKWKSYSVSFKETTEINFFLTDAVTADNIEDYTLQYKIGDGDDWITVEDPSLHEGKGLYCVRVPVPAPQLKKNVTVKLSSDKVAGFVPKEVTKSISDYVTAQQAKTTKDSDYYNLLQALLDYADAAAAFFG